MVGKLTSGFCGPVRLVVIANSLTPYKVRYFDKAGKPAKFSQALKDKYMMFEGEASFVGDNVFNSDINWLEVSAPKADMMKPSKVNKNITFPQKNVMRAWNNTGLTLTITF